MTLTHLWVTVGTSRLELRMLRRRDGHSWRRVRARNAAWLEPWEATLPPGSGERAPTFAEMVRRSRAESRAGRMLVLVIVLDGELVGQVTVSGITLGSLRSAAIGYWIDQRVAGRGLTPLSVALVLEHLFGTLGLHRVEVVIRPENHASLRVVEKLGFDREGMREKYLHIDGQWRDHIVFVMRSDQAPQRLAATLARRHEIGANRNPGPGRAR